MAAIKIGTTCSGKDLLVEGNGPRRAEFERNLAGFDEHDLFDFAVALECLRLAEIRRGNIDDPSWRESLESHLSQVMIRIGPDVFQRVREELGIVSAFAARDHGKECLAAHFRG